jgi:hypothetical protein
MEKRAIFVLSPGRCGTATLAELMKTVPGVAAFHEPNPNFADWGERVRMDHRLAIGFWDQKKTPHIKRLWDRECDVYVETSHQFMDYADHCPLAVDVIKLRRDSRDIALSHWRRSAIPGRTPLGLRYLQHPESPYNVRPLDDWETLSDYQLCYWHALEAETKADKLVRKFKLAGRRTCFTSIYQAVTRAGFERLLREMELPEPEWFEFYMIADKQFNANPEWTRGFFPAMDLDNEEAGVKERLA